MELSSENGTPQTKETQIDQKDSFLYNFNTEVKHILEKIVAVTVETCLRECSDEEESKLARFNNIHHPCILKLEFFTIRKVQNAHLAEMEALQVN